MNKNKKKWLKSVNKQYDNKNGITFRSNAELRVEDEGEKPAIILKIVLGKFSPFYGDERYRWRERITTDAFNESLAKVKSGELVIKSYIDHDRSVRGLLSSTNREGVTLTKTENEIVMVIPVIEGDEQLERTHEQIRFKEITSNSFIMHIDERKIAKKETADGIVVDVTITKARLVSIDPVYEGFYKNNIMEARNVESITPLEIKLSSTNNKGEKMFEIIKNKLIERKIVTAPEAEAMTEQEVFDKYEAAERAATEEKIKEIKDEKVQEEMRANLEASIESLKTQYDENTELRNSIVALEAAAKKVEKGMDVKEVRSALLNGQYFGDDKKSFKKGIQDEIVKLRAIEDASFSDTEKTAFRNMTGLDADSGSQVIPVITDSSVISEDAYAIPELEGAKRIALVGEATTKVPVKVDSAKAPTRKKIGEASDTVDMNTVTTELTPAIFSEDFSWNQRLRINLDTLADDTRTITNGHILGWRKEFATSIIQHVGVTFDSLKGTDSQLSNYKGGVTSDAVVISTTAGALALADFDLLEGGLVAKYGKNALSAGFVYYMNSTTWSAVKELARASNNDITVNVDAKKMTINGIRVITNDDFAETITAGKHPILLYKTSNVRVYGGQTIIVDSKEAEWKKRLMSRQVTTLGEMFLADPKYTSRALEIKTP